MSLFTSRMMLLSAVVIDEKAEAVTKELLKLGLLDFIDVSRLIDTKEYRLRTSDDSTLSENGDLRRKLETLYKQAGLEAPYKEPLSVEQMTDFKADDYRELIRRLSSELQGIREKQKKLHQEHLKLKEISEYLNTADGSKSRSKFLLVNKGRPQRGSFDEMIQQLKSVPHFAADIPESGNYFVVSLKRDQGLINDIFTKFEWVELDEQLKASDEDAVLKKNIEEKAAGLQKEAEEAAEKIRERVMRDKDELDLHWKNLRLHELYGVIRKSFSHTERTSLFSGWLPAKKAAVIENSIRAASDGNCIIEWSKPEAFRRETVPVEIRHSKVLDPFKMLVENYAVPEYGTIDPTIFVAVAYMIMFGLMFGDAGQGLVIVLIGIIGGRLMKRASDGIKKLMQLFIYCGTASIISGVLFGSYFGHELFPALWFNYHGVVAGHGGRSGSSISDVYDILRITIYFGIAVIGTGLLINWINLFRKRDFFHLFLDKSGILGGWFYGCGLYTSFYFVGSGYKNLPEPGLLTVFFGIPVIILFFKAPLHYLLHERKEKDFDIFIIIDFIMEWIVEILEIFSGYLSNTLSFMRVAGLGIAHVSLMVAFDTIAGMTSGAAAVIILIFGNMLVIALEGLSAGIQALRLNYYEFFSRYFTGKGIAYNPVSLRNRKQEG